MDMQAILAKRRDGGKHSREELVWLANAAARSLVPDYQLSAWLMAAYLRPLDGDETAWLTEAMARSGELMDLSGLPKPWVDKHSTGGVGDKTSIALLPILAACGLTIVKMSGRGLGITGGTVDKLASIPGFDLNLSPERLKAQAAQIGLALTGQTPDLAPADKALYALRDATATVSSVPLIVSSIISKKMAGGADTIILDVKCGSGAFMETEADAGQLADALIDVGRRLGLGVRLAITDMTQPLGSAVGNAIEVAEAVKTLRGDPLNPSEARFKDLVIELAAHALVVTAKATDMEAGRNHVTDVIDTGKALAKMKDWFDAQGATVDVTSNLDALPQAPVRREVAAPNSGWLQHVDAGTVGRAVIALGGGREKKEDAIDPAVGVRMLGPVGSQIKVGEPLFVVYARTDADAIAAESAILAGIEISPNPTPPPPLVLAYY